MKLMRLGIGGIAIGYSRHDMAMGEAAGVAAVVALGSGVPARAADVPPALSRSFAAAWEMERLQTLSGSHVGPLLGREAADIAVQAVEWLNRPVPDG